MPDTNTPPKKNFFDFLKDYIALAIVVFSFAVVIILVSKAFSSTNTPNEFSNVKDIIGIILPVIGTWMGTILAFYFTKENFESASRSMQQTINKLTSEEKLKSLKVKEVMIYSSQIDKYTFKDGETWDNVPIALYLDFLEKVKRQRLVIFEGLSAKYVIHKSTLNSYIYDKLKAGLLKEALDKLTLADLIKDAPQDVKDYVINTIDFVTDSATLFEAQQKMNANPICQDIFVTATGSKSEPVEGWVTNVIVTEKAKV